jgi:hypothetical protein
VGIDQEETTGTCSREQRDIYAMVFAASTARRQGNPLAPAVDQRGAVV